MSDFSDWISAGANVVIAIVSIIALDKTGKYMKSKLDTENIDLEFEINDTIASLASSVLLIREIHQSINTDLSREHSKNIIETHYVNFISQHHKVCEFYAILDACYHRLEQRKKSFTYDKQNEFNKLFHALRDFKIELFKINQILFFKIKNNDRERLPEITSINSLCNIFSDFNIDSEHKL
ncbi:hypothetical protein ACIPSQ_06470 [Pectobacterium parvum]|uniref:hypothetical protein n=1 Tax=Pectobacterium parvum TaxID=2778550 RepID=UPI003826CCAF